MTSRERVSALLSPGRATGPPPGQATVPISGQAAPPPPGRATAPSGRKPDRVGLFDAPWGDTLGAWMSQGYPSVPVFRKKGEKIWMADGRLREVEKDGEYPDPVPPWRHFGYDLTCVGGWYDWQPRRGESVLIEETDEWEVKRNGAGAAFKYWKHKSGTPEHVDFLMASRQIWERDYRPHLLELDLERLDLPGTRKAFEEARQAGVWTYFGHIFVWEILRASLGDVSLYENLLLDPGWIRDFNQVYTSFFKTHHGYLLEHCGAPDGIWIYDDLGYRNGLLASPKVLADLIFPFYRDFIAFCHSLGLPVILHSCGSVAEAVPMIVEAGFDALNPMERKAAGNDPFAFAERYGDRIAFIGGLDARVLETNDPATIRREVAAYIDGMKARGARLVFMTDHSISPRVRYQSYLVALEVYREHASY